MSAGKRTSYRPCTRAPASLLGNDTDAPAKPIHATLRYDARTRGIDGACARDQVCQDVRVCARVRATPRRALVGHVQDVRRTILLYGHGPNDVQMSTMVVSTSLPCRCSITPASAWAQSRQQGCEQRPVPKAAGLGGKRRRRRTHLCGGAVAAPRVGDEDEDALLLPLSHADGPRGGRVYVWAR